MRRCSVEKLDTVFASIAKVMALYLPVCTDDGDAVFSLWKEGVKRSTALNTAKSPKELFFPQTEDMMAFKTEGKSIEVLDTREPEKDFVVFGVRPCDVKALEILDRVFLTEPRDSYYASKREKGIIISVACSRPSETCFCNVFGIDPCGSCGDVTVWETDEWLYWQSNSDKGKWLLNAIEAFTEECDGSAVNGQKARVAEIMKKLPFADLDTDSFGGGKTDMLFDRPEWETLSESCLGCGTCTFVCPTCQCYDIKDFNTGKGVIRYRCWDSCMYSEFTKMAHGNNRNTQKERFRQRFMHKLVYFPENNNGIFGCVGCGRCLAKCPISMNIVKVMKKMGGKKDD